MTGPHPKIRFEPDPDLFEAVEKALGEAAGTGTGEARAAIGVALTAVYQAQRKHAGGYRGGNLYRLHQEARHHDHAGVRVAAFDRGYAAGIEAAASDVAKLLGVDEAELIESARSRD